MKRSDLKTRVLQILNDTTPTHWSQGQINDTLQDALEFLTEHAKPFRSTVHLPLREGVIYYYTTGFGDSIMAPYRLWAVPRNYRIAATTISELDQLYRRWENVQGPPWVWAPVSWDCFAIWPKPSAAGGIIEANCLAWPRTMQDDNDELEIGEADVDVIIDFAVYDSLLKRFDTDTAQEWAKKLSGAMKNAQGIHGADKIMSKFFHREPMRLPTGMPRIE